MLFLIFELGRDRYALPAAPIVEVLPVVRIKRVPHAPAGVIGVFDYHGAPVPVIDLSELTLGRPAAPRLSTRLIVVSYPDRRGQDPGDSQDQVDGQNHVDGQEQGRSHLLGLIAERATDTMRRDPADFVASGISTGRAPYLGHVTTSSHGVVQRIDVDTLLPDDVRESLFEQLVDQ
jgi:chemotaxis-related protein WspB